MSMAALCGGVKKPLWGGVKKGVGDGVKQLPGVWGKAPLKEEFRLL